jgi:hypothetical protein
MCLRANVLERSYIIWWPFADDIKKPFYSCGPIESVQRLRRGGGTRAVLTFRAQAAAARATKLSATRPFYVFNRLVRLDEACEGNFWIRDC